MIINVTTKETGKILQIIRKKKKLTLEEFTKKINKSPFWEYSKENNKHKIYINDFLTLAKVFDFNICFTLNKDERKLYLLDYEPNNLIKYASIETGRNNYYTNDLFKLAVTNEFKIDLII